MAFRGSRANDFEELDYYRPAPASARSASRSRVSAREYDEVDVHVQERDRERNRMPAFLRDDRRGEAGPMVLRKRDVESFDRHRRSPSPVRVREERLVRRPKSVSPPHFDEHDHSRTRFVERERVRSPSVVRQRSPSPRMRYVERRPRSPSPTTRDHIRIVERERERIPSPSPSPSPSPPRAPSVVRGPTLEREVITHYTDIDHGTINARRPEPVPAPAPAPRPHHHHHRERDTRELDIDISMSKNKTDVDIHRSSSRARSRSRERPSRHHHHHDDDFYVSRSNTRLEVDDYSSHRRRARSAAPLSPPVDREGEYITSKIDSRGRMGEAWHSATKDWNIVDVPPGTERVRMDGAGGGGTDTTWSKYSGVRRTQFIPERDGGMVAREPSPAPVRERERNSSGVYEREWEIDIDRVTDRRASRPQPPPKTLPREMWTEITRDLVIKEAIEQMGYEYEERGEFFYVMEYLRYDDVLRLTEISEEIRRSRKDRVREIEWERDYRDDYERRRPRHRWPQEWDDERISEREVIYDSRGPARGRYYR